MLRDDLQDRKICILGFGREGQSTYHFLRENFPDSFLTIADRSPISAKSFSFLKDDKNVGFSTGPDYLDKLPAFDLCFKTPGITLQTIQDRISVKKITSQADLFLKYYGKQTIGITGTKGKSTTASLLSHVFNVSEKQNILVGNIGLPPFDFINRITRDTLVVYELSSHQLETVKHSPWISVLLNIFEEHLDHYNGFGDYLLAKLNILQFQQTGDHAVLNADDNILMNVLREHLIQPEVYFFSQEKEANPGCFIRDSKIEYEVQGRFGSFNIMKKLNIIGRHNLYNAMAAVIAAKLVGLEDEHIAKGLLTFKGLRHRMEYLGEFGGVHYYNDSISTIPQATIEAIKTLGEVSFLILGGYDRGINYEYMVSYLSGLNLKNILLMGPAGQRIQSLFAVRSHKPVIRLVNSLKEAVYFVKQNSEKGDKCLLSPAAASYDAFSNFEERGAMFERFAKQE